MNHNFIEQKILSIWGIKSNKKNNTIRIIFTVASLIILISPNSITTNVVIKRNIVEKIEYPFIIYFFVIFLTILLIQDDTNPLIPWNSWNPTDKKNVITKNTIVRIRIKFSINNFFNFFVIFFVKKYNIYCKSKINRKLTQRKIVVNNYMFFLFYYKKCAIN